jgi:uncharacterized protein with von Willebrand factor type A (vWA) domain
LVEEDGREEWKQNMIGYRYFYGSKPTPQQGADADKLLDKLSDLLLHENDLSKSLDLLKQQGMSEEEDSSGLQGVQDFLEAVRRLKQQLQDSSSSADPSVMEELKRLEKLEHELRRASWGMDLEKVNSKEIQDLLGEEQYERWNILKAVPRLLEISGYIERLGAKYVMTPKGIRKIGQKALQDIFATLNRDALGNHEVHSRGHGATLLLEDSKPYEFGDPFHLNLTRSLLNSVARQARRGEKKKGSSSPISLHAEDFEVYSTEKTSHSATVLMLDMSGSMARDEKFFAAKKVALALHNLIQTRFPKDRLHLLGFSSYARSLKSKNLPFLNWDLDNPYTNMEEGLILAKALLLKEHTPNKQIILISDGEPTAHKESGQVFFQFPPHPKTLAKTLLEFRKCSTCGIRLNIFMLGQDAHLVQFVQQVSKINRGRAFYTTPKNLGQYLLVDFLSQKKKLIHT